MSRADRVAELIKREVSEIICQKMRDPRIAFTSITKVEVAPDLRNATVHVSVFGTPDEKKGTIAALIHGAGFIQKELAEGVELRYIPALCFKLDESIEKASKVITLMNKIEANEAKAQSKTSKRPTTKKVKRKCKK